MKEENLIPLKHLCRHFTIEMSFFDRLNEYGLIEIRTLKKSPCIPSDKIHDLEKMIRLHRDLDINLEGIDAVFNLLERIDALQEELLALKNRLRLFETEE